MSVPPSAGHPATFRRNANGLRHHASGSCRACPPLIFRLTRPTHGAALVPRMGHIQSHAWDTYSPTHGTHTAPRMGRIRPHAWDTYSRFFQVFCGNSDANQRCSANASQKAPHVFRASISTSPSRFNPRPCRGFPSRPRKFRANSALALGAKHVRRSVSEASLTPSEFDRRNRIRSTRFFEDPYSPTLGTRSLLIIPQILSKRSFSTAPKYGNKGKGLNSRRVIFRFRSYRSNAIMRSISRPRGAWKHVFNARPNVHSMEDQTCIQWKSGRAFNRRADVHSIEEWTCI